MRAKPTPAQAVEERSRLLRETTQFVANPFSTLREPMDTDTDPPETRCLPHTPQMISELSNLHCWES
ncbi:hypothetical protein NDU88_002863 [Pleurodeles waltl]|uniref:Uncharacterized protein n=1 Tax=Pleurodeles waltl TaxID=8319 RepID=A0AAV7Q7B5_PLEWA|nr:hypothetical protein NDU88_002863 [Pleurodeles waltl]